MLAYLPHTGEKPDTAKLHGWNDKEIEGSWVFCCSWYTETERRETD